MHAHESFFEVGLEELRFTFSKITEDLECLAAHSFILLQKGPHSLQGRHDEGFKRLAFLWLTTLHKGPHTFDS
jgi:hypothetical protein